MYLVNMYYHCSGAQGKEFLTRTMLNTLHNFIEINVRVEFISLSLEHVEYYKFYKS